MRLDRVDRWLGAALTVGGLVWLWLVHAYIPDIRTEGAPGPRGFPLILGVVLTGLGAILTGRALASPDQERIAPVTRRETGSAIGTLAVLLLYAFLLDKVGFVIATPIVITLAMLGLLRMRRWLPVVSLAVGFTAGCWFIFGALLGTPLPRGAWTSWP